jgi:hypothetical protein
MAYRDALYEVRSGNIVILRRESGTIYGSVANSDGSLISTLPLFLRSRLEVVIRRQLVRPVATRGNPAQRPQTGNTINSKAAGRLLAAGGIYNGNPEGFRKTAEQLGGDAVKGYDSVLNETTSGMMVAAASLLVVRNPVAAEELTSYLGKYKMAHVLLDDVAVTALNMPRYVVSSTVLFVPTSSNRFPGTLMHYQRLILTILYALPMVKCRPVGRFTTRSHSMTVEQML